MNPPAATVPPRSPSAQPRQPRRSSFPGARASTSELIARVEAGVPYADLEALQRWLQVPMTDVAGYVGISRATLQRRKRNKAPLTPAESDRVVRLERLILWAIEVLDSQPGAREWLTHPQHGLGGATPLDYAKTEVGAHAVENLLGRIAHGVF